jgi:alpha-ketoglutarate-dependent taurine dioxygenase
VHILNSLRSLRAPAGALAGHRPIAAGAFSAPRRCGTFRCHDPDSGPRALNAALPNAVEDPFALDQAQAYLRWRERKLARYPRRAEDLVVEVRDPRILGASEVEEIQRVCSAANMAVYASPLAGVADKDIPRRLGARLALAHLDANPLADEDGISSLEAVAEKSARGYIPYSNRRLLWHTDGYYNAPERRIRAFILHCVRPAATGGENRLLDHEIAYILLRDADPEYIKALSAPDAMTIPANAEEGAEFRPAQTGPVFSADAGALHMRYTARTRSIEWRPDETTRAAVQFLNRVLDSDSPYVFALRLAGGQGLVCNNVLHNRSAFADDPALGQTRLVYRARYSDRVAEGAAR